MTQPTGDIWRALCAEVETLRNDIRWLGGEVSSARHRYIEAERKLEMVTCEKERAECLLRNYQAHTEKTKGQVEADKLASLIGELDGRKWAEVFCFMNPAIDKDIMIGWFCNAVMCGYDVAISRMNQSVNNLREPKPEDNNEAV